MPHSSVTRLNRVRATQVPRMVHSMPQLHKNWPILLLQSNHRMLKLIADRQYQEGGQDSTIGELGRLDILAHTRPLEL